MKKSIFATAVLIASALLSHSFFASAASGENVRLYGTLVAEPCVLKPGDENIPIDFGNIVDKYLYTNGRSPSQPFQLRLLECDLSIGKQVSVTFSGDESDELSQMLAVNPAGTGIAIAIADKEGKTISLNSSGEKFMLKKGVTTIEFSTYVQATPKAIASHNITRQPFYSTATFRVDYE